LLIAGGHSGEFSQPTALYQLALAAGADECVVALPDVLIKLLGGAPATTFVPSSPSGSLGREALGQLLELAEDCDGVVLGASLSANSQTAILIERFIRDCPRPIIAFDDCLKLVRNHPDDLLGRPDNLLVVTMPEVFKLCDQLGIVTAIKPGGGLANKLEIVSSLAARIQCGLMVYGTEIITTGPDGLIVTPSDYRLSLYPAVFYATAAVFWVQNRSARLEGLATAAFAIGGISQQVPEGGLTVAQQSKLVTDRLTPDDF
jgi:NAD(P)H-hydrate repair Nnr-like enzyme with NAD(P)H-hydrate dehydratase domain